MRYMIMHKTSGRWEAGEKPTLEVIQRVGGMIGDLERAGVMRAGEGLGPSAEGARVRSAKGEPTVTPGPFSGEGALPARYALFRAASVARAAEIGVRLGRALGDVVVDVRPMNEPWDLGFAQKPEGLTTRRYMAVVNANAASEAGVPLAAEQKAALGRVADELAGAGELIALEHFEPSRKGRRLRAASGRKRIVVDGPFSETKELIGGFVIVEVPAIEDAVRWAERYWEAVDVEEIDVRGLEG